MNIKTKSRKFLEKVAKDNELQCSITDEHCIFGYNKEDVKNNIGEYTSTTSSIENSGFYIKEYMFYAALGMGSAIDEWLDNATGLASIRFCLVTDSMMESTVVVSDIFQEEMVVSISLEEVLEDMLGLNTGVDDFDDVDYDTVKKVVDSMKPVDLLCIYYIVAKKHWEE